MPIVVESQGPLALVRIEERGKKNALTAENVDGLEAALTRLDADGAVRVVVLAGADGDFSAGADLRTVGAVTPDAAFAFSRRMQRLTRLVADLGPVTVAALEGWVLGAGMELALAVDLRVVSRSARLGVPEVRYGLVPAAGGTVFLADVVGRAMALRLLLTGDAVTPDRFPEGVFVQITEPGEAEAVAVRLGEGLAARPRAGQTAAKRALALQHAADHTIRLTLEADLFQHLMADPEVACRINTFLEKADGSGPR